jgi:hypothetical protein
MEYAPFRIEVYYTIPDSRGTVLQKKLKYSGYSVDKAIRTDNYLINIQLSEDEIVKVAQSLIQPVTQN